MDNRIAIQEFQYSRLLRRRRIAANDRRRHDHVAAVKIRESLQTSDRAVALCVPAGLGFLTDCFAVGPQRQHRSRMEEVSLWSVGEDS